MIFRIWASIAIVAGALIGCSQNAANDRAKTVATADAKLIRGDAKTLEETIARHKGAVVLVDYWATWCVPCVENFPHTVELSKKYGNQGLAVIAVSFDLLDDEPKVRDFLTKQGADFENLISKYDGVNQRAANDFDIEVLPEYRLYDRQGKLRQKWQGPPEDIETKIEELLAEKT